MRGDAEGPKTRSPTDDRKKQGEKKAPRGEPAGYFLDEKQRENNDQSPNGGEKGRAKGVVRKQPKKQTSND